MQLLERNNLIFELRIESLEDLWVLSQFIVPEDKVFATTERKVKLGDDRAKQVVKIIFVDLIVKKVNFESESLRVSGEILNETEFTAIGQSHTLTFNVNDKIKIEKKNVLKFEESLLKNAIETKKSKNLLVLMDKDELIAVEFTDFNFSVLFEKSNLGSKKYVHTEVNEEEEKFLILEEFLKRDYSNVVFAGPGLWKDRLSKYVKDKVGINSLVLSFGDVSNSAVSRVLKEINEKGVLQDSSLAKESEVISKLLENINKGEKYIYGYENSSNAVNEGRVEVLLVSNKFLLDKREDGTYNEVNELMKVVESLNGNLVIVNSKNETGKVLDGLGGIGGILRY